MNDDKLKETVFSTPRANLDRTMKPKLESYRSVMILARPEDQTEPRKERTQKKKKKIVDVLETLDMRKKTEGPERAKGYTHDEGWTGRPLKVTIEIGENNEDVLRWLTSCQPEKF